MPRCFRGWCVTALLALLVSGCTLLPAQPTVERSWFLLEVPDSGVEAEPPVLVELASVRVAPAFTGKALVYRLGSYRYESDFYNEWFLPPREQVEQLLRERWTRADAPVTLVADARAHPGALQLDVLVTALHADLGADAAGVALIGMRVFAQGSERSRLWELERRVPMRDRSPEALVAALSKGMGMLLEDLEQRLGG